MQTLDLQDYEAVSGGFLPILPTLLGLSGVEAIGFLGGFSAATVGFLGGAAYQVNEHLKAP